MRSKKGLNRIIIVIVLIFAVVCSGLFINIFRDMQEAAALVTQNLDESEIEYEIWIPSDVDEQAVRSMYTSYDEKRLGVKFKVTSFDADLYEEILITSGITNTLPDMFYISEKSYLTKLVDIGAVMDMTDYIEEINVAQDFVEDAIEDFTVNHRIYGLPLMGWEEVLYCNTTLFDSCRINYPTTHEAFITCMNTFKEQGMIPLLVGGKSFKASEYYYRMLVNSSGSLEEGARALEEIVSLSPFQQDYASVNEEEATKRFINGESAMLLGTTQVATLIEHSKESRIKESVKVISCPPCLKENIRVGNYGCGFVLNPNSLLNETEQMKAYYESFERRLSWEIVIQRGKGLPVYKSQHIEKTRFNLLSRGNEIMLANNHKGIYEKLLTRYERSGETSYYELQVLRLMHGQIDAEAFLSALRL